MVRKITFYEMDYTRAGYSGHDNLPPNYQMFSSVPSQFGPPAHQSFGQVYYGLYLYFFCNKTQIFYGFICIQFAKAFMANYTI